MPSPSLTFNPPDPVANDVLALCADPALTLSDIAARHHTSLEALTLFLFRPDIAQRLESSYAAAAIRTRFLAAHLIPKSLQALTKVLDQHDELSSGMGILPMRPPGFQPVVPSASPPTSAFPLPTSASPPTSPISQSRRGDPLPTFLLRQRIRETTRRAAARILSLTTFNPPRLFALASAADTPPDRASRAADPTDRVPRAAGLPASGPPGAPNHPPLPPVPQSPLPSVPSLPSLPSDPLSPSFPRLSPLPTPLSPSLIPGRFSGLPDLPISTPAPTKKRPLLPRSPLSLLQSAGTAPHEHWP